MSEQTTQNWLPNVHPGEILLKDYLEPMGLTKNTLATAIGVPATRIGELVRGRREGSMSSLGAMRLGPGVVDGLVTVISQ